MMSIAVAGLTAVFALAELVEGSAYPGRRGSPGQACPRPAHQDQISDDGHLTNGLAQAPHAPEPMRQRPAEPDKRKWQSEKNGFTSVHAHPPTQDEPR